VVEALLDQVELMELIVVSDGSTDGTVEWAEERRRGDSRLRLVVQPTRGVAARQAGLEAASGDIVLFLDDDVVAAPGLVAGHARHHCAQPNLLVAGYMPNEWRRLPRGQRGVARVYRTAYERTCERYEREPDHILLGFWAGNFSLRRTDGMRVGLLSTQIPPEVREEDREFGIRCFRAGLQGRFDRALHAEHLYSRDLTSFRRDCRRSGSARPVIHELHPDIVGVELLHSTTSANTLDRPGQRLPEPIRRLWPTLATEPSYPVFSGLLTLGFRLSLLLEDPRMETLTVRALASLETQRGVLDRETRFGR
jgi:glycosyltransferase involved in cell wall biosynthesis